MESRNESHRFMKTNSRYPFVLKGRLRRSMKPTANVKTQSNSDPSKVDYDFFSQEIQIRSSAEADVNQSQDSVYEKSLLSQTMMTLRRYPPELVISFALLILLGGYILLLNAFKAYGSPAISRFIGNQTKLPDFTLPNFEDLMRHDFKLH